MTNKLTCLNCNSIEIDTVFPFALKCKKSGKLLKDKHLNEKCGLHSQKFEKRRYKHGQKNNPKRIC